LLAWACRTCRHLRVVGRLKAGVSVTDAERELGVLSRRIVADHPKEYEGVGMLVPTLHEQVTGGVKPALLAVLGAVALVLLIACANVTNLLLARAAQREGEFSVRAALGAGHVRVIRQLLTESLVLAAIGGVLGIGVAWLGVQALVALSPPGLPRIGAIGVNGPVLVFAVLITTTVGLAFGVAPALHATRGDLYHGLMRTSRRLTGSRRVTRASLVVSEVALAMVLLVGSGLLLRSMTRLFAVSPGFDPSHLLTMEVVTGGPRFTSDTATHAYFQRVLEAAGAVPGVETAALTSQLPLTNDYDAYGVHSEARPRANTEQDPSAHRYAVSGRYLETMRIPVLRGRGLTDRDRGDGLAVLLINQAFARREWPGTDPIGQRVRLGDATQGPWRTIVGIVGDVKQVSLSADQPNAIYVPEEQWPWADFEMSLVVRTRGDPAALVPALRRAVWSVDRDQPIVRVSTMERLVTGSAAERRFTLVLFESFAAVALIMAAAGIYGVLAGTVVERRPEIGVRAALGATRANILMLVVRQGLGLTTIGIVLGLAGAAAMARIATSLLFGISPVDLFTYVGVTVLLVVVALAACWIPAWRAARLDPMATLRTD
jgi:putative ABC transport system permease protein